MLQTQILFNINKLPFYISVSSGKYFVPVIFALNFNPKRANILIFENLPVFLGQQ